MRAFFASHWRYAVVVLAFVAIGPAAVAGLIWWVPRAPSNTDSGLFVGGAFWGLAGNTYAIGSAAFALAGLAAAALARRGVRFPALALWAGLFAGVFLALAVMVWLFIAASPDRALQLSVFAIIAAIVGAIAGFVSCVVVELVSLLPAPSSEVDPL